MYFIKNIKFGIKEPTSGKKKIITGSPMVKSKNLTSSRIKLQKNKKNRKGFLFSKINFRNK